MARVKERFYWPDYTIDVARWCAACSICASRKGKPGSRRIPMSSRPTGAPFERIATDILDTRKLTRNRFQYIIVVSDYFTKWTEAYPLRKHTAEIVADVIAKRWISHHGVPKEWHSDQGPEFEGKVVKELCKIMEMTKIRTSPYRPQSDGMVERFNRTLLNLLSAFVNEKANDWCEHLPYLMFAYRSAKHATTGCSPFSMVYGRECAMPVDLIFPDETDINGESKKPLCGPEYVQYIKKMIQVSHDFARRHMHQAMLRQKRGYDTNTKDRPKFQIGDYVRYYYKPLLVTNKMGRPWTGPWKVVKHVTDVDYKIELVSRPGCLRVIHMDNLKRFECPFGDLEIVPNLPEQNEVRTDDHPDDLDPLKDEIDIQDVPEMDIPGVGQDQKVLKKVRRELKSKKLLKDETSLGTNESGTITNRRPTRVVKPMIRFQAKYLRLR
jgi:hypothetical protein